jgi:hypothetical protein
MRKCERDAKMRKNSHRIAKKWGKNGKIDRSIALSQSHSHRTTSPAENSQNLSDYSIAICMLLTPPNMDWTTEKRH